MPSKGLIRFAFATNRSNKSSAISTVIYSLDRQTQLSNGTQGFPVIVESANVLHFDSEPIGHQLAYAALLLALKRAKKCGFTKVYCESDSSIVITQMEGSSNPHLTPTLAPFHRDAMELLSTCPFNQNITFKHIQTFENVDAENLAREAMKSGCKIYRRQVRPGSEKDSGFVDVEESNSPDLPRAFGKREDMLSQVGMSTFDSVFLGMTQ
ncbi:hypothetical protein HDU79_010037 [Rhizoclosmatium sp. JEL0117]|nr:hypothetical protein HDU79_010037 [Rhizoclosmatium sp. JEL0117]